MERKIYTIDASNKPLGRLAVRISILLRGKNRPDFAPYKDNGADVVIKNIDKIKFTGNKLQTKIYYRHSGYLGSLKATKLKDFWKKDRVEVLRRAVYGMMPKNRLRAKQILRLKIETPAKEAK